MSFFCQSFSTQPRATPQVKKEFGGTIVGEGQELEGPLGERSLNGDDSTIFGVFPRFIVVVEDFWGGRVLRAIVSAHLEQRKAKM